MTAQAKIEKLFEEGIALRDSDRLEEAIEKFKEILTLNPPRRAPILGPLGHIYWKQKSFAKALECYTEAVSLSPKSELGSLGLFHTLWDLGRYKEALAEARRFLSLRDSEEYFLLIEEMRDAFLDAGIDPSSFKKAN